MTEHVSLDEYGYKCSSCAHLDAFNEESLLESPPVDVLTVKLLLKYNSTNAEPPDVRQLHHFRRQCAVTHTIPCASRSKHLPIECPDARSHDCFREDHWRLCDGFFKVKLVVEYTVTLAGPNDNPTNHISCVRVCKILPNNDRKRGYESNVSTDDDESVGLPIDEGMMFLSPSEDILRSKDRCRNLMDYLFCMDCKLSAINGFTFLTSPSERCGILEEQIILQKSLHIHSKSIPRFSLTGVLLHCNGEHLAFQSPDDYAARAIFIPSENLCRNLYSKRKSFTPKLFFHSYEIYRGAFGRRKIHVTLVLTSKTNKEVMDFCEQYFEPLSIRTNPFLQISPGLKFVRKADSMDPGIGLYIRVIFAANFLLTDDAVSMNIATVDKD